MLSRQGGHPSVTTIGTRGEGADAPRSMVAFSELSFRAEARGARRACVCCAGSVESRSDARSSRRMRQTTTKEKVIRQYDPNPPNMSESSTL